MNQKPAPAILMFAFMLLYGCSGGSPTADPAGTDAGNNCSGSCTGPASVLQVADVQTIIAQGVAEAQAQGVDATIAVVDRVGNVLAVYRMGTAANREVTLSTSAGNPGSSTVTAGLEGIRLPVTPLALNIDDLAAIAKAVTGAYLSSEGNAFSSRTASQIVQDHFNPGEQFQPGGPLFGVQFSQLACSDFNAAWTGIGTSPGPHRSPLGLSADPGGFPIYIGGTPVGGVGVIADDVYGVDAVITDSDRNADEMIAYAATFGYAAPQDRRGDQITVEGKVFRFSDVDFASLTSDPASAAPFASIPPATGALIPVNGYTDGVIRAGTQFGDNASGIAPDPANLFPGLDAFVLVDAAGTPRYPPIAGTDGGSLPVAALSANEVQTILQSALDVANRARAQIRRPFGSQARVTISVVDTDGEILGVVRGRDAPMFGADVSLQKARTATFFSTATAATYLNALPSVSYLTTSDAGSGLNFSSPPVQFADYVSAGQAFLNDPNALTDGLVAFSDRAGGNLSRPYYPDGIDTNPPGPFSKPAGEWSPFSTGLQLDLTYNAVLQHVLFAAGAVATDVGPGCAGVQFDANLFTFSQTVTNNRLANGLQIFPGSVPIFRGDTLVGGIGVSGDGVDQDDMIAFLGVHNAGEQLGNGIGNAPPARRADNLTPQGTRLRYIQCPQAPFLNDDVESVCDGK
jgi:uncharacterized protein GlcG (DUF336 family)